MIIRLILSILLLTISFFVQSQSYIIKGKISEIESGNPIPFASVVVSGSTIGTTSNFDGVYQLKLQKKVDSLTVSYIGFKTKTKKILVYENQTIHFQLEESVFSLDDVVVYAGENPAFLIMRSVIDHKKENDKRSLEAYQYESYSKIELAVNNITERFKNKKLIKKIKSVLDSIDQIAGEDGLPILPVFLSETISTYYYKKKPKLFHEDILRTKISGVGVSDGTSVSQVIGSTFQQYNFYNNWISILNKHFASPIGNGWNSNYEFDLIDSLYIDDSYCYRLDFWPKRSQDLAFRGTIWISKAEFALKQIDVSIEKVANLNYIEKIKIQQTNIKSSVGPWLPNKTRVMIDVAELTQQTAGILAKFYVSLDNVVVNQPKPNKFYEMPISFDKEVRKKDTAYWTSKRHESLSSTELNVFEMIDTLKTIPIIKTYTNIIETLISGHFKVGKFDIGPYWGMISRNDVEGYRLGFGGRTNFKFSDKWILSGFGSYGFQDEEWKYKGKVERIISRNPWTIAGLEHVKDINPVWLLNDDDINSSSYRGFSRWGSIIRPFRHRKTMFKFQTTPFKGFTQSIKIKKQDFEKLAQTTFGYNLEPGNPASLVKSNYNTTEIVLESRIAKDELFLISDNKRMSLGTTKWPIITLKYILGLKNILGGDFTYHKFKLDVKKKVEMGILGYSKIDINGGYILSQLPYPLLKTHTGNELPIYFDFAFNLLNFFELRSDRYLELRYRHHFEGFILNRIPLIKKLKWRLLANINIIEGGMRKENKAAINQLITDNAGNQVLPFNTLKNGVPYIEVGYGLENIFKIFRISAFHRITYTGKPNTKDFGIRFGFQLIL